MKRLVSISKICLLCIFLLACNDDSISDLQGPDLPQFNIDLFEQNLTDYVNAGGDAPVGWAYAITQNGNLARSAAFGFAVNEPDGTQVPMTVNKEMNIASVTKFYTAIVAMQLLDALDLDVTTEKIIGYLPPSWNPGPNISELTFADLLRHESGFETNNTNFDTTLSYSGLQNLVEAGIALPPSTRDYDNANFAIFRILIPSLQNQLPNAPLANLDSDQTTQAVYRSYMQSALFDSCGLSNIDFSVEANNPTKYYNVNDVANAISGINYDDWSNKSGGGGYYMTVIEMAAVNAFYQDSEILLTNDLKDILEANYFGLDTKNNSLEIHGDYFSKNGAINNGTANQGVTTQIAMFPINNITVAVVCNTRGVNMQFGTDFIRTMIFQAYNNAYE